MIRREKNVSEGQKYLYVSSDRKEISVSTASRQNDIVMMTTNYSSEQEKTLLIQLSRGFQYLVLISTIRRFFHFVTFKQMPFL